jgi:hypothetical protein
MMATMMSSAGAWRSRGKNAKKESKGSEGIKITNHK